MAYDLFFDSPTFAVVGGTSSAILASFSVPEGTTIGVRLFVCMRSVGLTSFAAFLEYAFEHDLAQPVVMIGTAGQVLKKGTNASDWQIFVEPDPDDDDGIRIRWTGTVASDVACTIQGIVGLCSPPV